MHSRNTTSISREDRRARIVRVSRFFQFLSALAALGTIVLGALTWSLPVVSVGRSYKPPSVPAAATTPAPVTPGAGAVEDFPRPRMYVELAGNAPEYRWFTWDVAAAGSGIRAGREWWARTAAFALILFGGVGAVLCYRLFAGYAAGEVFTALGVRRLRSVAIWKLAGWGMALLFQASSFGWAEMPHFGFDLGAGLVPGLFLYLIAWIMAEAQGLAEEQALTI